MKDDHRGRVDAFSRMTSAATTINQLNSILIRFEERLTPDEVDAIFAKEMSRIEGRLRILARLRRFLFYRVLGLARMLKFLEKPSSRLALLHRRISWIRHLAGHCTHLRSNSENVWKKTQSGSGYVLYCGPPTPNRALLVGFTSAYRRMMIQTPLFLSAIDNWGVDFLMVQGQLGRSQLKGIPGLTSDFRGTLEWIESIRKQGGYRWLGFFGTSLGGIPAVAFARACDAQYLVTVGAGDPTSERWEAELRETSNHRFFVPEEVTLAWGGMAPRDLGNAEKIAEIFPHSRIVEIPNTPHDVFWDALNQGQLRPFLDSVRPVTHES